MPLQKWKVVAPLEIAVSVTLVLGGVERRGKKVLLDKGGTHVSYTIDLVCYDKSQTLLYHPTTLQLVGLDGSDM